MNNQNQTRSEKPQNPPSQKNAEYPPPYNPIQPNYAPQNQPQYIVQQQGANQVFYQQQPTYYNPTIPTVLRSNVVLIDAPIARQQYQYMCRPTHLPHIDERRINLLENYPVCFVILHSIIIMILGGVQIAAEFISLDHQSAYYGMTVGWYCGGFMLAISLFTMLTVCIRQVLLVRMAMCFNLIVLAINVGFAIIIPALDMTDSTDCFWKIDGYVCIERADIDIIVSADIAKIVSGAIAIKMYIIFTMYISRILKNKRYASTSYEYVNPNYTAQGQVVLQTEVPNYNSI